MKDLVLQLLLAFAALDLVTDGLNWNRIRDSKTRAYQLEHLRLGALQTALDLLFWVIVFHFPLLDILDETLSRQIESPIWQGAAWLASISLARSILSLPLSIYSTFSIEERFGFNRTSRMTFASDRIKGLILGLSLGVPLLALLLKFFTQFGNHAWWIAWISVTGLSLILSYLAPMIFLPLFNRFTPLPEGALREAIEAYAKKEGFAMKGTFVMDGSKRSSKRNAFFTGFGNLKKLVLFDTLIEKHTSDEIVAIVAHEMGHFKLGHIPRMILSTVLTQGILFFLMGQFLAFRDSQRWVTETFSLAEPTLAGAFLLMGLLYIPLGRALSVLALYMSRKHEYQADTYSKETFHKPEALIRALRGLEKDHLSHPNPHPIKVWMEYSHPPVSARAKALGVSPQES